jgi:hypothetical protein
MGTLLGAENRVEKGQKLASASRASLGGAQCEER